MVLVGSSRVVLLLVGRLFGVSVLLVMGMMFSVC